MVYKITGSKQDKWATGTLRAVNTQYNAMISFSNDCGLCTMPFGERIMNGGFPFSVLMCTN